MAANVTDFMSGPIPGQSLADTPGNYPWEKPPEMVEVEDVIKFYINKLANQDIMDDLAVVFEADMPISSFVKSLTTSGTMFGKHTLDAGSLAGPAIHAFLKAAMTSYGIEARDEPYDPNKDPTEKEKRRLQLSIELAIADAESKGKTAENDPGVALLKEMQSEEAPMEEEEGAEMLTEEEPQEEAQPAPRSMGLMSKEM
jgi:hypothetical protein